MGEPLLYDIKSIHCFGEFKSRVKFRKRMNSTFVTAIPKVEGATELSMFRHISLVRSHYKIIAKLLVIGTSKNINLHLIPPKKNWKKKRKWNTRKYKINIVSNKHLYDINCLQGRQENVSPYIGKVILGRAHDSKKCRSDGPNSSNVLSSYSNCLGPSLLWWLSDWIAMQEQAYLDLSTCNGSSKEQLGSTRNYPTMISA